MTTEQIIEEAVASINAQIAVLGHEINHDFDCKLDPRICREALATLHGSKTYLLSLIAP